MTTSLAEQLKKLAVPQTTHLLQDKKRPSLLFDTRKAAGIKKDTAFEIGLEGFQELLLKNPSFEQFSKTLFHFTSKDFERSVNDAESNEKLNNHIKKFLLMLTPYFLLNCTYKALEWLIYRYQIQDYNREEILMLVLPYHESNIFVRVIQLLKFKDVNDTWYFLKTLQKPGVHLPKKSLLNHAASDMYFIKFVGNYLRDVLKVHDNPSLLTVSFNFYCSVFTGAIEYSKEVKEKLIVQMLPTILSGLSSDITDFCAASYVIVARLVAKITLSNSVLDNLFTKIAMSKVTSLKSEAMLVYLVIYQSQKDYKQIPIEALDVIARQNWFGKSLQQLNSSGCYIYPFLEVLLRCGVEKGMDSEEIRLFIHSLLEQLKIDAKYVEVCLWSILDGVPNNIKNQKEAKKWLSHLLEMFETQYPSEFDKTVYNILMKTVTDEKDAYRKEALQRMLNNTLKLKSKFELFDKLYHPNALIRTNAIKFISSNFHELKDDEKLVLRTSFEDKLNEEDVNVVQEALLVIKNTHLIENDTLKNLVINLLNKYYKNCNYWEPILDQLIEVLCDVSYVNDLNVLFNVFPLLIPRQDAEIIYAKKILSSNFFLEHPLFKNVLKDLINVEKAEDVIKIVLNNLKFNQNEKFLIDLLEKLTDDVVDKMNYLSSYVTVLIVSNLVPKRYNISECVSLVKIFNKIFMNGKFKSKKVTENIYDNFLISRKKFCLYGFLESLTVLLKKIDKRGIDLKNINLLVKNEVNEILLLVSNIIYRNSSINKKFIEIFNETFFKYKFEAIDYMLHLAVFKKNDYSSLEILKIVYRLLKEDDITGYVSFIPNMVINLFILMLNPSEEIRTLAIEIGDEILKSEKKIPFLLLLKSVTEQKQEIILDNSQLPVVVSNIFEKKKLNNIKEQILKLMCYVPLYIVEEILEILILINDIRIFERISPLAFNILNENKEKLHMCEENILINIIKKFNPEISVDIKENTKVFQLLLSLIKNDKYYLTIDEPKISPSGYLLQELESEFINRLNDNIKCEVLDAIIEISTISPNPEILTGSNKIFKHISLDANLILPQLNKMKDVQVLKNIKRSLNAPTIDILETLEWKKGIRVLELIQYKKKLLNSDKLLAVLFQLLKKCLDFEEQAPLEYSKQLILSLILHSCEKLGDKKVPESVFNMELVVQCIRASPNPQTHHHALLVLALCSKLIPTQVLHHIMAIFTFMGSSVLRHDNAYSFQLIINIIDAVIPILVEDNNIQTIISVLTVFVDVILDVPEHRRLPLYKQLLLQIHPKNHMHLFLILLFQSHVLNSEKEKKNIKNKYEDFSRKRIDIGITLAVEFEPQVIFESVINLLKYLKTLPIEKNENDKIQFLDAKILTQKHFRHFKYSIITYINNLLSSPMLINKIAMLDDKMLENLEPFYKDMIINSLLYLQKTTEIVEDYKHKPQEQYWQIILKNSYDILDHINALLTPEMFLLVVKGLMSHNLTNVRKRSLELLNFKLQTNTFFNSIEKQELYKLVNPIVKTIESVNTSDLDHEEEQVVQTALYSLKLLVKILAKDEPEKFITILEFVTNILRTRKKQDNVLASIILCVAELCINLKVHSINYLPHFMPSLLKLLKKLKKQESPGLLLLALLTALQKILEILPLFLSPYLSNLVVDICLIDSAFEEHTEEKNEVCVEKLKTIKKNIGKFIVPRVLIPIIEESYNKLIEKNNYQSIGSLMNILSENVSHIQGQEMSMHLPDLTKFFLNALQFRNTQDCSLEQKNLVENKIIESFSALTLKLSETSFRPLYFKLFDWAVRSERKDDRIITFYNLSKGVAKHLKSLFVLFAGHFVNNAAQVLDSCNKLKNTELYYEDYDKNILLLNNILDTLLNVFKYDTIKFLNKERFEVLMQPIVDQLENDLGGLDELGKRNNEIITPCIVQFAVATADDSLWKQMNYQILLKMRHSEAQIRLYSLKCLTEVVKQLGEDFLPLLPETIPFLAELLEDEDENVEMSCKKSVQEMEQVLGEPLQKYF